MSDKDEDFKNKLQDAFKNIKASAKSEATEDKESRTFAKKEEQNWPDLDQLANESKSLENQRYKDDTEHRKVLSTWAGTLVSFWLVAVILILTNNTIRFKLSDSVLIALLGTTTLNVLGLMVIVLNDIFNKK